MKKRDDIIGVFAGITEPAEMEQFFNEIFTPREREALILRWQLLKELFDGETQRAIASRHRISLCKITRGSKILKQGASVTRRILEEQEQCSS